jgi:signal peptidase II
VKYKHALLIILAVILVDQFSKIYVKTQFFYGEDVKVLGSWFRLHFIENEGMAYGMKLSEASIGKLILSLFRLVAVVFGFFFLKTLINKGYNKGVIICSSLILAGALGNLIDSMFYGLIFTESSFYTAKLVPFGQGYGKFLHGRVVDMLYFPIVEINIPKSIPLIGNRSFLFFEYIFNVADAAISVGVMTLLFFQKSFLKQPKLHPKNALIES